MVGDSDETEKSTSAMSDSGMIVKLGSGLLLAGVVAWGASITRTVNTVTGLEPVIEQILLEQARQGDWIADWPSNGELAADVRQTKDIEFLFRQMEESQSEIDEIKARMRAVEQQNALTSRSYSPTGSEE